MKHKNILGFCFDFYRGEDSEFIFQLRYCVACLGNGDKCLAGVLTSHFLLSSIKGWGLANIITLQTQARLNNISHYSMIYIHISDYRID